MLLWPSNQAEVIFATPPKRGAASPPWLKALLSPRPKWQTWFYLYILTRVCGVECWESYLKLYKDLADTRWLVELFQFFFFSHGVNHPNRRSLCRMRLLIPGAANGPDVVISVTLARWEEVQHNPAIMRNREWAFGAEARIRYIPALSQSMKTFTNVPLWKFRWW